MAGRLLLAQAVVLAAGAVTAAAVAVAVGPAVFHQHLRQAGVAASSEAAAHAELAFRAAGSAALGAALLAALLAALAVSLFVTARIGRSVRTVVGAADDLSAGRLQARVPDPQIGPEFDALARAFNSMADQLLNVETTRHRLLGDLAHELRTPIATLDAYLEGVEDGVAELDPTTVRLLRTQTSRLTRLAEDVAAVSRAEEGQLALHLSQVDPSVLLADAVAVAAEPYAERGVALEADLAPGLPGVRVDPARIGQVLANVLDNALRHTPAGGRVSLTARTDGDALVVVVADTGEGIPPEHLPHIFERFYRVDTARDRGHGGSGIGLAIVKAILEAHGGSVSADSQGAGSVSGTTVTVTLPTVTGTST